MDMCFELARLIADALDGAVDVADEYFTSQWVATRLPDLLQDQARLEYMAQTAKNFGITDAAETMVRIITETKVAR